MDKDAFQAELRSRAEIIDRELEQYLPGPEEQPPVIHQAMRYSVFAGGKRLRPLLVIAGAEAVGGTADQVMPTACAMEMIHTYSLIHDDLPAMDDDDYRRGRLTSHKVFGEAIAVLAGDALLTGAFELMARNGEIDGIPSRAVTRVISEVAFAAGSRGMIGGQVADMENENRSIDAATLHYIHAHKTAALFRAALRAGAILAGAGDEQLEALTEYAAHMGLAFQITDDILDVEGSQEATGKPVGSDEKRGKSTYPALYGIGESKRLAQEAVHRAVEALHIFGREGDILRNIARYLLLRDS
ncbi:MAG: polyprenyl synthetase family protein [Bacillota bacterium]